MSLNPVKLLLRIPVPWVFILTYLVGLLIQVIFPLHILPHEYLYSIKISGIVSFAAGVFFATWSLFIFHRSHTTTTPGESSKKLIMHGPYRFSRNPMYVSLILAYLGEAGFLSQFWPVMVLPFMIVYLNSMVIPLEEEILRKDFKEEYENYCAGVRRWL